MNDASLIIVSQEVFLEADEGQGEIPWPWGLSQAVCVCVYVIVTQHDFFFPFLFIFLIEGLQGKAESGVLTRCGDAKYSSLYENLGAQSERIAVLQREVRYNEVIMIEYSPF